MKKVAEWQKMAVRARKGMPGELTQEEFHIVLGVSTSEIRRWEQGKRAPTTEQAILLGKLVGPPDCWFWWELAGLPKREIQRALVRRAPDVVSGEKETGRYSEEARVAWHGALDVILVHARKDIADRFIQDLEKIAGRFGEPSHPEPKAPPEP